MKKLLCLIFALLILLCGCTHDNVFTINKNGNIVTDSGVEYAHLANAGFLYCFGDMEFVASIQGEEKTSQHMGLSYQTGMFAINDDDNDNILIRHPPDSEWYSIYRKASLPAFDFSVDNCIRLELVFENKNRYLEDNEFHTTCGDGVVDASEIAKFLSEVRSQKDPREAGLYDLITKPDGMLENCYVYGVIYGFFKEEPNLAVRMDITSYNDLAYSISIEGQDYCLPIEWLQKLENK